MTVSRYAYKNRKAVKFMGYVSKPKEKESVTPSCGCVFCDVGLMPTEQGWHKSIWHKDVKCERMMQIVTHR